MRTERPPSGAVFRGPVPTRERALGGGRLADGTAWPVPLIAANDHRHMRQAGAPCRSWLRRVRRCGRATFQTADLPYGQPTPHRPGCPAPTGSGRGAGRPVAWRRHRRARRGGRPRRLPRLVHTGRCGARAGDERAGSGSIPGSEPLQYEGPRERYLPEVEFRGRVEHRNSQYTLYAARSAVIGSSCGGRARARQRAARPGRRRRAAPCRWRPRRRR